MGSVHELAPSAANKPAEVGGVSYRIRGLTSDETVCVLDMAPSLASLLTGVVPEGGVFLDGIRALAPIIKYGCDIEGEDEKKAQALKLPLQLQMQLAGEIVKRTFPDADGPFGVMAHALLEMLQIVNLPTTSPGPLSATSGS